MPHNAVLNRIRAEYLEMPGLRMTLVQAQRLCGVERALCEMVLARLVDMKFLCVNATGTYARVADGADHPHSQCARAEIKGESTRSPI